MVTVEQEQKILKAKVAVMLYTLLGRMPKDKEISRTFLLIRMMPRVGYSLHTRA